MSAEAARKYAVDVPDLAGCGWHRHAGSGFALPTDMITWRADADSFGRTLHGTHTYVLRFESGLEPPARGFWSIGMYNRFHVPVDNPIRRYAISDHDSLIFKTDGALEIYIQNRQPGPVSRFNWLPSPVDEFFLELTICGPFAVALDGGWQPPALRRLRSGSVLAIC